MPTDVWTKVQELARRVADTSQYTWWVQQQNALAQLPNWQREVLSHLLATAGDEEITFLDAAVNEEPPYSFVAVTQSRIIAITVTVTGERDRQNIRHDVQASLFPRTSVREVRLKSLDFAYPDTVDFPTGLRFEMVLEGGETIALPISKAPSAKVEAELADLFQSVLP